MIILIFLIGLLIANYIVAFIIILSDVTDHNNPRLKELQQIKTKKEFWLYLVPYYLIITKFIDSIKEIFKEIINFYKSLL